MLKIRFVIHNWEISMNTKYKNIAEEILGLAGIKLTAAIPGI